MIRLDRVELRRGGVRVLGDASLVVQRRQKVGVVGANGAGKSSLIALLLGELEPDRGEVELPGDAAVATVAQEAPGGDVPLIDYVVSGDPRIAAARARLAGGRPGPLTRLQAPLADRLVLSRIRERTGGRLRFVVSGSAPLSREVAEFLYAVGLPVIEGYGLTETAPVLTVNPLDAPRLGSVGPALAQVELRIADDGEVLARGPNVMVGYYEDPAATAGCIRDGWFHTGDIGRLDDDGYLSITDRKKEILVTAGGKNVAPQPIEALLKRDPIVAEAMLVGDRRPYVSALLAPDVQALGQRLGVDAAAGLDDLVRRDDVRALFQPVVDQANAELAGFEQVKRFALLPAQFSIDTGELTPTLKLKRRVVTERWRGVIEEIYQDG